MGSSSPLIITITTTTITIILTIILPQHPTSSAPSYTTLVYKGCANQDISQDPTYAQALSSLYGTLISQSSKSKFYKTTTGTRQTTITGLFQCRGDLTNVDCYTCVSRLPTLITKLCGGPKTAARIQLLGCYMLYEVAGFVQISGMELLYRSCSRTNAGGVEERREAAFGALASGVVSGGFYATSYGGVYVLGQCEGDVGSGDCGACVKSAAQRAKAECGGAVAGQVYLHKCFVGYTYYPNGVPDKPGSGSLDSSASSSSSGPGPNTGKTVAIILGGAAGVGFLVICALFARGLLKKKDDY